MGRLVVGVLPQRVPQLAANCAREMTMLSLPYYDAKTVQEFMRPQPKPELEHDIRTIEQWQRAADYAQRCADRRRIAETNSNGSWLFGIVLLGLLAATAILLIGFGLVFA